MPKAKIGMNGLESIYQESWNGIEKKEEKNLLAFKLKLIAKIQMGVLLLQLSGRDLLGQCMETL